MSTEEEDNKTCRTDGTVLLSTFPEEVWTDIVKCVKKPADIHNVSNSSTYFHKLLHSQFTCSLFPLVANVLLNLEKRDGYFSDQWNPNLLINLRLVCRPWKLGVNGVLENPEYHCLFAEEKSEKARRGRTDIENKFPFFHHRSDFLTFQHHFDDTHLVCGANPIPHRGINVEIPDADDRIIPFYLAFTDFLQKYGTHIWYCILQSYHSKPLGQLQYFLRLNQFLELMPNLKVFISFNADHNYADNFHLLASLQTFPTLKHLVGVRLYSMTLPIVRSLVQANPQVQIVDATEHQTPPHFQFYQEEMKSLTKMAMRIRYPAEFRCFREASVGCQLAKLRLDIVALDVSWEDVFQTLDMHFASSLKDLWISLPRRLDLSMPEPLKLDNLERLTVRMQNEVPLDFLVLLESSLKTLFVDVVYYEGDAYDAFQIEEVVKDAKLRTGQFKDEIWSIFPKLREFRVRKRKNQLRFCNINRWDSVRTYKRI